MSGHTKGPWKAAGELSEVSGHVLWCGDVYPAEAPSYVGTIAHVQSCDHIGGIPQEEAAANARLIAAAPDLLAALERMHKTCVERGDNKHWDYMRAATAAPHLARHGAAPATTNEEAV